jgi:hypothetical protein
MSRRLLSRWLEREGRSRCRLFEAVAFEDAVRGWPGDAEQLALGVADQRGGHVPAAYG